jgi:capsular polysaccharide biosynthesis protein
MNQGVDSKALLTTIITKIPILLVFAVTGAIIGSGLNLVIATVKEKNAKYVSETEYYIEFAPGRYEVRDYYNAATWNDVMATDMILGKVMESIGGEYDKDYIKSMLEANILTDVRYLTVFVKGVDYDDVETVEAALEPVIVEFGETMSEFTSITKIEDLGILKEEVPNFSIRAALTGAVVFALFALFVIAFRFCLGSHFYTKMDITNVLEIPVYGIAFKSGKYEGITKMPVKKYSEMFYVDNCDDLIAIIPFGKCYREKIMDEIYNQKLLGKNIKGAILTEADDIWYKLYMGR